MASFARRPVVLIVLHQEHSTPGRVGLALKAMGAGNTLLAEMVFLQAFTVGTMGYGLGTGLTSVFGNIFLKVGEPPFFLPWQVLAFTGSIIVFICLFSASIGLLKVIRAEPAIVFR